MKLPINEPFEKFDDLSKNESIGNLVKAILQNDPDLIPNQVRLSPVTKKLLIRLKDGTSRTQLENLKVNKEDLLKIDTCDKVRGVIITILGTGTEYDFISRYFAPWVGIPEDPVTGSAHTVLTPFWSKELNQKSFFARQSSPRGGELKLDLKEDHILVSGQGTVVLEGSLSI